MTSVASSTQATSAMYQALLASRRPAATQQGSAATPLPPAPGATRQPTGNAGIERLSALGSTAVTGSRADAVASAAALLAKASAGGTSLLAATASNAETNAAALASARTTLVRAAQVAAAYAN